MMFSSIIALAIVPLTAMALPSGRLIPGLGAASIHPLTNLVGCPVNTDTLTLPSNQTALAVPAGVSPVNIALGVGVQNYTCTAAGAYTSVGAVATLFDISCLFGTPEFPKIQTDLMNLPAPVRNGIVGIASRSPLLLAYHYFVTNPLTGTGINPKFAQAANGGATFTTLSKKAGIKSADPANVDLLQLSSIAGDWASTVFRVDTALGQPPASCTVGSPDISVPYAAKYWFFK